MLRSISAFSGPVRKVLPELSEFNGGGNGKGGEGRGREGGGGGAGGQRRGLVTAAGNRTYNQVRLFSVYCYYFRVTVLF